LSGGVEEIVFFIAAIGAVAGAIGVIALRNPFYSVLSLVAHLLCLALLFLLLHAEFVAAAQVVVYAGAVMVLYVFVVAYVGGTDTSLAPDVSKGVRTLSVLFAGLLFVELAIAIIGTSLKAMDTEGATLATGFGQPAQIGELLLTRFLLPFEIASFLLLIAAVGAVTLARRRGGLGEDMRRLTPLDLARPKSTGTMAEGVGSHPLVPEHTADENTGQQTQVPGGVRS
jgi:NADH:ubiquinone oxidoreductase subunit 6 (subunit J)